MKYLTLLFLLLLSCSTPQETSFNGGAGVIWGAPKDGTKFFYRVLQVQDTLHTETSDSTALLSSDVDGTRLIRRFDRGLQLSSQLPNIFLLDANGNISLADSSTSRTDTIRYATGALPFLTRLSTMDSIAGNGDTITRIHTIRFYGRELPNVPAETGPALHVLDSTYTVEHGIVNNETIWAYNLWFAPEIGGIYAKYIEEYESVQEGWTNHYVEERDLVRYSK